MAKYGADATIVNMAYRAAMANVPKDVSGHLESQLRNYERTMKQITQARINLTRVAGQLLGQAAVGLKKRVERRAFGSTVKDEFGNAFLMDGSSFDKTITNDNFNADLEEVEYDPSNPSGNWKSRIEVTEVMGLNDISKAYRETFRNDPFGQESIAARMELSKKKQKIYSQIDQLQSGFGGLEQIFANEGYSKKAMESNYGDSRFLAAIAGEPANGDKVVKGFDNNGNIILKLFDANNNPILQDMSQPLSSDNQQLVVRADELDSLIIPEDQGVFKAINTGFESLRSQGASGAKGVTWETSQGKYKNDMDKVLDTEKKLHYAIHEDGFFNFQTSCMDDLTSASVTSATLFGALGRKVPVDENGNPVIDISGGSDPNAFDAEDFASGENYAKIVQAITNRRSRFYNEDVTREVFKEWAVQKGKDVWQYGMTQRKGINPWGTNATNRELFFPPDQQYKGGVTGGQLNQVVSSLGTGKITSNDGIWEVDIKTQKWTHDATGETRSGDQMLGMYEMLLEKQLGVDLQDFKSFGRFQRFRGTEGATVGKKEEKDPTALSSNQASVIQSMFGRQGDEDIAEENINRILNDLGEKGKEIKKKFRVPVRPGQDIIELNDVEYNLKTAGEAEKFIEVLNKMIGEVEGVKSVGDKADELINKYGD